MERSMPEWVKNELKIEGDVVEIFRLLSEVFTGGRFDFNKVLPMPAHQPDLSLPDPFWGEGHDVDDTVLAAFGDNTWFAWAPKHWGTKWNTIATEVAPPSKEGDYGVLWFESAWNSVDPVILELSEMFPTLTFRYRYELQSMKFGGVDIIHNGEFIETYTLDEYSSIEQN